MSVRLEPDLLDAAERQPGDLVLVVHAPPGGSADVRSAIDSAARSLTMVSHPDEPAEPWPSYATLETWGDTPALRVDLADRSAYPGLAAMTIGVLVAHLATAGHDCTVGLAASKEPAGEEAAPEGNAAADAGAEPAEDVLTATTAGGDGAARAFPWPADWLPAVRQVGRRRQMDVVIPRPTDHVVDELAESFRARGRLTALGRLRHGSRPWMLLAELDGHTYAASLVDAADGRTDLSVTTPLSWPELSTEERAQAMADVVWTVPPR